MVVQTPSEAVANANSFRTCVPSKCLAYSRTWLEIDPLELTAAAAWANANRRHFDRDVPKGGPAFWLGGSRGFGHVALGAGAGRVIIRSTDVLTSGQVTTVPLEWFDVHWPSLHFVGWSEDLNGVTIPYLVSDPSDGSRWAKGAVYVSKLQHGQRDSDSVARLSYRLIHHHKMPASHRPGRVYRSYNHDVLEAVRYWQRRIAPQVAGPSDGTSMSNPQANTLFGPNYTVHEK